MDADLGQMRPQSVAARVLAQDDVGVGQTDVAGLHDLVGGALLQHPVLVDARFVSEGILAHDRLVGLHDMPGEARDHAAGAGDLGGDDVARPLQDVAPRDQGHGHLFQGGVAGPFAAGR